MESLPSGYDAGEGIAQLIRASRSTFPPPRPNAEARLRLLAFIIALVYAAHFTGAVRVLFGEPDPFDRRMARRHLAAEQADAAAADDGKADALGRLFHPCFPLWVIRSELCPLVPAKAGTQEP